MSLHANKKLIGACLLVCACASAPFSQTRSPRLRQPREVVQAYRVCEQFQNLLAENLEFGPAFEATFTTNDARRREIAIVDGEFDRDTVADVDTAVLIDAYKSRMQLVFLMLPLLDAEGEAERALFFPPKIHEIYDRKPPETAKDFPSYALQLRRDVADVRAHLDQIAQSNPGVAQRLHDLKSDFSKKIKLPTYAVKPLTSYSKGGVLGAKEEYYQIEDYAVIREGNRMRIIGIRFFKLF